MHLESIGLNNFKNYESLKIDFSKEINCLVGKNGSGKTNLLDAIYYLCITKSAFNPQDVQCALHVVLIAPNDTDVIRNGSEDRRRFFDGIISQTSQSYLNDLIQYNHVLKQRNSLLKQFADRDFFDAALLQQYTDQLIEIGQRIYEVRKGFTQAFRPLVQKHYALLSEESEQVDLQYESDFGHDIAALFKQNQKKDLILKRTNVGIHKDEFLFEMEGELIKKFGSQGQQKSYLIALKLAHFDYIFTETEIKPMLLLDDIFDKLDDFRITKLMEMVASDAFGQIFVTDARPERSQKIFEAIGHEVKFFEVEGGEIEAK